MRSYTVTIKSDTIEGRFVSFVTRLSTVIWISVAAVSLLVCSIVAYIWFIILPYEETARLSSRAAKLRNENNVYKSRIAGYKLTLENAKDKIGRYLVLTDKLNLIFGIEEPGDGGFTEDQTGPYDNMLATLSLVEDRYERFDQFMDILDQLPIRFPLVGKFRISSWFGPRRSPFSKNIEMHRGIDITAVKNMKILAAGAGTVKIAGRWSDIGDPTYARLGLFVKIEHGSSGYETIYGHCSKLLVKQGEKVKAGQPIALLGSTGWSTAPHLHFGICHRERYVDPKFYLLFFDAELIKNSVLIE